MPTAFAIAAAKTDSWGISVGVVTEVPASSLCLPGGDRQGRRISFSWQGTPLRQCGLGVKHWEPASGCSRDNKPFGGPFLRGVLWSLLGVQLGLISQAFRVIQVHTPCVKSLSAYITACNWTCPRQSALPMEWQGGVCRGGSGRQGRRSKVRTSCEEPCLSSQTEKTSFS